ncbi:hypothetical protein EV663_13010 [Rhodovulum bhavnagarense]|uniref:Uncharacterized protein n=1 Tax=Rhodovulum bhavnagarense TaxID=992286 RepID=A0A4R2R8X8_9RHOB|nr:hypothetical protein EV663_13010 [Rhodovulum bhavnagarense]
MALEREIRAGRSVASDLVRIAPLLNSMEPGAPGCDYPRLRLLAILSLYRADLLARRLNISPSGPSDNLELLLARGDAMRRLQAVLQCAPRDGDMWLRLAIVGRSLNLPPEKVEAYLRQSFMTAPFEDWIARRRHSFFPDHPFTPMPTPPR